MQGSACPSLGTLGLARSRHYPDKGSREPTPVRGSLGSNARKEASMGPAPPRLHYKPACSDPSNASSPLPGSPTQPMTPGSSVPYTSTSQEVKSPFLPDLKPSNSHLSPSGSPCDELQLTFPERDGVVLEPFHAQHNLAVSNHAFQLRDSVHKTLMLRPDLELQSSAATTRTGRRTSTGRPLRRSASTPPHPPSSVVTARPHKPVYLKHVCQLGRNTVQIAVTACCCSHLFVPQLVCRPPRPLRAAGPPPALERCITEIKRNFSSGTIPGTPGPSGEDKEIIIGPMCSGKPAPVKPVPVKPDVHVKEEPDGPVLQRCCTPPSAPAPGDYPSQSSSFLGPGTFPNSFLPTTSILTEFTPGPPPVPYQSDIPRSPRHQRGLLPASQVRWHQQVTSTWTITSDHQGCMLPTLEAPQGPSCTTQTSPWVLAAPGPSELGSHWQVGLQCYHRHDGQPPSGAGEAPEPALDLLPELTNPNELPSYLGPPDLPTNSNDDLLSFREQLILLTTTCGDVPTDVTHLPPPAQPT
ncbi:suppressor of variegation 2-10-like isoform 2 [Camelus ferus]|nr:suppressor of variegation 2-10-like isoform 2 [Camelus ferus]